MSERAIVTARELGQDIEVALAQNTAARIAKIEVLKNVRAGAEGYSSSAAIFLAAATSLHAEGFSEEEIMRVFQKGLEELGVPVE